MPVQLVSRVLFAGAFWVCPLAAQNGAEAPGEPGAREELVTPEAEPAGAGSAEPEASDASLPDDGSDVASELGAGDNDLAASSSPVSPRLVRGRELRADGNCESALQEFAAARSETVGRPESALALMEMAQCYESLGRYDDALAAYRGYLAEGPPGSAEAAAAREAVQRLEGTLGQVQLSVGVMGSGPLFAYEVWVDGRYVARDARTVHLPVGRHELEVRTAGFEAARQEVVVSQGTTRPVVFKMTPQAQRYDGLHPAFFWTGVSLTAATALTGGLFGLAALGASSGVEGSLAAGPPTSLQVTEDDRARIDHLATTADVFFVSAGVLAAGTVALGFFTDFHRNKPRSEQVAFRAQVFPSLSGLTVRGAF